MVGTGPPRRAVGNRVPLVPLLDAGAAQAVVQRLSMWLGPRKKMPIAAEQRPAADLSMERQAVIARTGAKHDVPFADARRARRPG
jgi:hypothetical protein